MAQHDYNIANQGFSSFRSDLNNVLSAIQTTNSGTSTPTGAVAGTIWLDTTSATTPTLKYYDGTDNISLATIDHVGNTVNWLDSTVSITGLTTTATGTVLTLSDSASTSTVNLIIDNQKEIRFRETTANGTNYVALKAPASLSADLTFTLPSADGTNGQVLKTNGSGVLSFEDSAGVNGAVNWDTTKKTSGFTAVTGVGYFCDTTSLAFTVTLPITPSVGNVVGICDYANTFATNNITVGRNGSNIGGVASNALLLTNGNSITFIYVDATQGWIVTDSGNRSDLPTPQFITATGGTVTTSGDFKIHSFTSPGTFTVSSAGNSLGSNTVDYLVVAGGASGGVGNSYGGGGGAGGFRQSFPNPATGGFPVSATGYPITVGAGGASRPGSSPSVAGNSGNDSIFSTITSAGGGGGGGWDTIAGITGGSGGGAATPGGSGASGNTPPVSPPQGNPGGASGPGGSFMGGGGGASEAGNTDGNGEGGDGTATSITGSSTTFAGGGGGASPTPNAGGAGGGGASGQPAPGVAGTANTGGGGGGNGLNPTSSGAGGSGIVVLRYKFQ